MTELTLQQKADYLAEHLLGWTLEYSSSYLQECWFRHYDNGSKQVCKLAREWHPQHDISHCFQYIVSAMNELHYTLHAHTDRYGSLAEFVKYIDGSWNELRSSKKAKLLSTAIVEAAYAAIEK